MAVEAVEGTDGAIRRGGELAREGAVVVKRCKPQQDLRFDLPAVGPGTIEVMEAVKASVLALEAGRSVLLDRDETIAKAEPCRHRDRRSDHDGGSGIGSGGCLVMWSRSR